MADHLRRHGIDLVEHLGPAVSPIRTPSPPATAHLAASASSWPSADTPARLPIPGADWPSPTGHPALTTLPRPRAVVGGADTGCQIASILADLGTMSACSKRVQPSCRRPTPAFRPNSAGPSGPGHDRAYRHDGDSIARRDRVLVEHPSPSAGPARLRTRCSSPSDGPPTSSNWAWTPPASAPQPEGSRSTPTCAPKSNTSSPPATSTADPCWSKCPPRRPHRRPERPHGRHPAGQLRGGAQRQLHRPRVRRGRPYRAGCGPHHDIAVG